jgi:hypothetical protein
MWSWWLEILPTGFPHPLSSPPWMMLSVPLCPIEIDERFAAQPGQEAAVASFDTGKYVAKHLGFGS